MNVKNVATLQSCIIRLWVTIKNEIQLIDDISIEPLSLAKTKVTQEYLFIKTTPIEREDFTTKVQSSPKFESSSVKTTMISPMLSIRYIGNITTYTKDDLKSSTFETTETSTDLTTSPNNVFLLNIEPDEPKDISSNNWILILLFGSIVAIVILMVSNIIYRYYKSRKNREHEENVPEEIIFLDVVTPNGQVNNTNIKLEDFETYVRNQISTTKNLENQFRSLPDLIPRSRAIAKESKNINKNKDRTYIPYDHTRVVLKELRGVGTDDYINASYINGYNREKAYIACQGPKFSTIKDFWRLIWQENVETIIMATNFFENKKRMCAEYWPQKLNTLNEYGNMIIKLTKVEDFEHHTVREFEICYESYTRKIRHFYLKWGSDDENPIYPNTLVPVVKCIRQVTENSNVPIVIHSGFGVNRTGTLILCDLALTMAKSTNEIDIFNLTKSLREQRPHMVNQMKF
jgi:protein tyrosine phosphatase